MLTAVLPAESSEAPRVVPEHEVRSVHDRLRRAYMVDKCDQLGDSPLRALVRSILSQNTTERDRDGAMRALDTAFPDWSAVPAAPEEAVAAAIARSNNAVNKARRIQRILGFLVQNHGRATLDFIRGWSTEQAENFLLSIPGVGRNKAASVLLYALHRPVFPVSSSVRRVATRLGWMQPEMDPHQAHDRFGAIIPVDLAMPLFFEITAHAHFTCRVAPVCARCPIFDSCIHPNKSSSRGLPPRILDEIGPVAIWTPGHEELLLPLPGDL